MKNAHTGNCNELDAADWLNAVSLLPSHLSSMVGRISTEPGKRAKSMHNSFCTRTKSHSFLSASITMYVVQRCGRPIAVHQKWRKTLRVSGTNILKGKRSICEKRGRACTIELKNLCVCGISLFSALFFCLNIFSGHNRWLLIHLLFFHIHFRNQQQ